MGETKKVILKVRNLSKDFRLRSASFGGEKKILHALSNVSIDIYEGETLGIIGESGCGKSTFGKCLVRLHEPTGGEIEYEGKSLLKLRGKELKHARKDLQMVFQDPFASLTGWRLCILEGLWSCVRQMKSIKIRSTLIQRLCSPPYRRKAPLRKRRRSS